MKPDINAQRILELSTWFHEYPAVYNLLLSLITKDCQMTANLDQARIRAEYFKARKLEVLTKATND